MRNRYYLLALLAFLYSCSSKQSADLIVHNGKVYTVDSAFTVAEAFAVKDGKIVEVGKNDAILNKYTAANTYDAQGKAIYPGFIDAHAHFVGYGRGLYEANLWMVKDWNELFRK
jgi:predicted amidohydrolase YtcJ